jgi:predicted ATPase
MLIAVSGSQGLGKSTLINALRDQFDVDVVERKTSRSILSDWGVTLSQVNNDRELTTRFQDEILNRKLADELQYDQRRICFTERSYADLFGYALIAIGKDNEYSDWLNAYYERCKTAQHTYSHIYYLSNAGRFPGKVEDDGVRAINRHYATLVDHTFSHYTTEMDGNVIPIRSGDVGERIDMMVKTCPQLKSVKKTAL